MERRKFLGSIFIGTGSALVLGSAISSCRSGTGDASTNESQQVLLNDELTIANDNIEVDLSLAENAALLSTGGFIYNGDIIIANTGNNEYLAVASACTHMGCKVSYSTESGNFPCGCHGSEFSTTGAVITGPATEPLKKYLISKEGEKLIIKQS